MLFDDCCAYHYDDLLIFVQCDVKLCTKRAPNNPYVVRRGHPNSPAFVTGAGPIPVAARSKAWVCGRSIAGVAGSNPAEGIDFRFLCFVACCVGGGLCEELITRPGGVLLGVFVRV